MSQPILPKSYRAVFFDAGGTLFEPYPSVGEIYARVARKYGMTVDPERIGEAFRSEFSRRDGLVSLTAHSSEKNERQWWKILVRDCFEKVTPLVQFDDFFDELYDLFARSEVWRLYSDVLEVIGELKARRLKLGIVSNWDSRLQSIASGMKLGPYFDFILASAVVGSAKPDRGIFLEALKRASVEPHEALHVGDSVENDYAGARKAGLDALVVNRNGRALENIPTIFSLREILTLIC